MEKHPHGHRKFFALHAHFYQPPRENPWTGVIDPQPSAWPHRDWNARIARECYIPNAFARISDSQGRALELANNYLYYNFNFGPTLFSWLQEHHPFCCERIIRAARESRERTGHSNAIAQAYNHLIMPLAPFQDQLTQALWGIKDFEARYGFRPEAMWLPETAASDDTLRLLVDLGMKYVILSPYQAERVKPHGSHQWTDVSNGDFDVTKPYVWHDTLPDGARRRGRSLAVFFYDGPLSKAAAFEGLTADSSVFADRVDACFKPRHAGPQLVSMAVDGETFGHHHKFSDMTLAHAFRHELKKRGIETVNFGSYLELHPPADEVRIKPGPDGDGTAWSCAHGVRRWKGGCDCGSEGRSTSWRLPFRAALTSLREAAAAVYASEAAKFFRAPWEARNDYAELLLDRSPEAADRFFETHSSRELSRGDRERALELLELQKHAMFMFTSCGWFFADVSRIEAVQNLRYAARVAETMRDLGFENADKPFLTLLEMAHSSYPEAGNALKLYTQVQAGTQLARQKAAALILADALLEDGPPAGRGPVKVEQRAADAEGVCLRGTVSVPGPSGPSPLAFCYLRRDMEFPAMYFAQPSSRKRLAELFSRGGTPAIAEALGKEPGLAKIAFEDFSWDERTLYAGMLAEAAKHRHAGAIFRILEDHLYLLDRVPGRASSSWAPLRSQAAFYARQAAEILFSRALHSEDPGGIERFSDFAERLKASGLEYTFEPPPEEAAALAARAGEAALREPAEASLRQLLLLLKAARCLASGDLVFHLQNYLSEIFEAALAGELPQELQPLVKELYSSSGMLIERFGSRLEQPAAR
ncbi:MAG: DUF3536 domain-containing protein [Elusimicrobia bacterium]|nr:DUF3536 domain-containing protein [Elusimicrobiota bacterium]